MGLFKGKSRPVARFAATRLDRDWFMAWADQIRGALGDAAFRNRLDAVSDTAALAALMDKASAVIDHDCADYVRRYCAPQDLALYGDFVTTPECQPWALISLVVGLKADPTWAPFIVEDMASKLSRFAEIMIDPDSVK